MNKRMEEELCVVKYICIDDDKVMKSFVCTYDEAIKTIALIKCVDYINIESVDDNYDGDWKLLWIKLKPTENSAYLQCIEVYLDFEEDI